jgi:hypothetical protein
MQSPLGVKGEGRGCWLAGAASMCKVGEYHFGRAGESNARKLPGRHALR